MSITCISQNAFKTERVKERNSSLKPIFVIFDSFSSDL